MSGEDQGSKGHGSSDRWPEFLSDGKFWATVRRRSERVQANVDEFLSRELAAEVASAVDHSDVIETNRLWDQIIAAMEEDLAEGQDERVESVGSERDAVVDGEVVDPSEVCAFDDGFWMAAGRRAGEIIEADGHRAPEEALAQNEDRPSAPVLSYWHRGRRPVSFILVAAVVLVTALIGSVSLKRSDHASSRTSNQAEGPLGPAGGEATVPGTPVAPPTSQGGGGAQVAAAPAAAGGAASQDIEFIFPDGNTIEAALVREMATIGDFSYLKSILGDYGVGLQVTYETNEWIREPMVTYAIFPNQAEYDRYGRLRVSEDLRGATVEIAVVRQL